MTGHWRRTRVPAVRPLLFQVLALALLGVGCASGGSYDGDVYRDAETRFRLSRPGEGWRAIEVEEFNDLAWGRDGSVIQVNSSCDPSLDIPLEALTNHLMIGFTERALLDQERVPMAGREALRTHVRAKLDGVPRELLLVVLKKNECVYDFALVAPPGPGFERASSTFDAMLASFETR